MWKPEECNRCWKIMKDKIAEQGEGNVDINDLENYFNKAIEAAIDYGKQMALKLARARGPWGAWM